MRAAVVPAVRPVDRRLARAQSGRWTRPRDPVSGSARTGRAGRLREGDLIVAVSDGAVASVDGLQLGGILVLEARDLNHAIELMSKHPGVKAGPFEIRPAEDLADMIRQSERRRSQQK